MQSDRSRVSPQTRVTGEAEQRLKQRRVTECLVRRIFGRTIRRSKLLDELLKRPLSLVVAMLSFTNRNEPLLQVEPIGGRQEWSLAMPIEQRSDRLLGELPILSRGGEVACSMFDDSKKVLCSQLRKRFERTGFSGKHLVECRSRLRVLAKRELVFGDVQRIEAPRIIVGQACDCRAGLQSKPQRVVWSSGSSRELLQLIPAAQPLTFRLGSPLGVSIDDCKQVEIRRFCLGPAALLEVRVGGDFERARIVRRASCRGQQTEQAGDQGA